MVSKSSAPNTPDLHLSRRRFLQGSVAASLVLHASPVLSQSAISKQKKLVWVFLRGALDGLHAVIPLNDKYLKKLRGDRYTELHQQALPLTTAFGLHPDLTFLHDLYQHKQMSPIVAVASGYRKRSHFDAQDQMESGMNLTNHDSGWLSRALAQTNGSGIALAQRLPIAMRGMQSNAETWYPSVLPEASEDLLAQLNKLYQHDSLLHEELTKLLMQKSTPSMQMQEKKRPDFGYLAQRCGELLNNQQADCAMLELGGWDTHNNQNGRLTRMFRQLDSGLKLLRTELGQNWQNTLVVVSTEFGRTLAFNGSAGTDHGTASSMFVLGGALPSFTESSKLKGGKILGKWPGLAPENRFQDRDLLPTSDVRFWLSEALKQHWSLPQNAVERVFPDLI